MRLGIEPTNLIQGNPADDRDRSPSPLPSSNLQSSILNLQSLPPSNLQSSILNLQSLPPSNLQSSIFNPQSSYLNGQLVVNGHVYRRPCDWAAECGPTEFLGGPRAWTPAAQSALATISPTRDPQSSIFNPQSSILNPLRGLPGDFLVFAVGLDSESPTVCGLTTAATTLTVRFEDVWLLLPPDRRAFSYTCEVTRDPHSKDAQSAKDNGIVRESLPNLAHDARICLDLADNGGFVLSFHPES